MSISTENSNTTYEKLIDGDRSNYSEARPLLVVFHDPPEARGLPNARTSKLELHNIWVVSRMAQSRAGAPLTSPYLKTDVAKTYVEWAVQNNFAVIDVNVPKHVTGEDVSISIPTPFLTKMSNKETGRRKICRCGR